MKKTFALISLGAILEYYDFAIYIYFAKNIGSSLIPLHDETANIIASFGILALGAFFRPLGGIIFSHFGDTRGRKNIFVYTILMMSIPTFLIGLIPSYTKIGILSTILLVIFRLVQGFAIGGELPGSIVFAYEISMPKARALNTNIVVAGTNIGFFLASILGAFLLSKINASIEAWRIAFSIGGIFGIISYYLRKSLVETPEFANYAGYLKRQPKLPLLSLWSNHKLPFLQMTAFGLLLASSLAVYSFFMPSYLSVYFHYSLKQILKYNSFSIFIFIISALIAGKYDWLFGKKFFIVSICLYIIATLYLFAHYPKFSLEQILISQLAVLFYVGLICGRLPVLISSFFPVHVRYSGVALSYNICFGIIAGLTQFILFALIKLTGLLWLPAVYITLFALCALLFFITVPANKLVEYK